MKQGHSPSRSGRHQRLWLLFAGLGVAAAVPAKAQDQQVGQMANDALKASEGQTPSEALEAPKKKADLLVVPIPMSNPTLGSGLTVAGVMFYNPNQSSQPWITGVGAMYTSNKSKGIAAFHSMSLAHDRFRVLALGGYADVNVNFYGIGSSAGDRDVSIKLDDRGTMALLQGQYRVAKHLYAGARYQFLDLKMKVKVENPLFPDLDLSDRELKSRLSAIGPAITYDSRDSSLAPGKGAYITAVGMFNIKDLGSDFSYDKWQVGANAYFPLMPGTTIAVRGAVCSVSSGGPFYDLCLYGQGGDLRGYEAGRYRDRASWAAQAEWRQHLGGKFGAVFFIGAGGIGSSLSDFDDGKFLPSAGMGLRFRASKETGINLRLDFAMGKDSHAIYFGIGEVF